MKKKLIVAGVVTLFALPAFAQTSGLQSTSTGTGTAQAGAQGGEVLFAPTYGGSVAKYAASTAVGDALVASLGTCMGSSALGAQGMSFGVNLGTTWHDSLCDSRNDTTQLFNMGSKAAAFARLCENDDERYAIAVSGGIPYVRPDGVIVHRACPMTKAEWQANGSKLINPITGQPYTDDELNPPARVAAVVPQADPALAQQAALAQRVVELQAEAPKGYHVAIIAGQPTLWKDGVAVPVLTVAGKQVPAVVGQVGPFKWNLAQPVVKSKSVAEIEADAQRIKNTSAIHEANAAVAAQ